jgi:hypothetical protein
VGFMDKMKVQAEQLAKQAQQGMAQGQAKLSDMQAKKAADGLLHDLGAAVYAAQRQGASNEPIEGILAALDAHAATHGPIDTAAAPPPTTADAPAAANADGSPAPAPASPPPAAGTPAGDFTMDDL